MILVIGPHGMDETLGCGGTMARHAAAGERVETLILFGDGSGMDADRRIAAPAAAKTLGTAPPRFVGLPENQSDTLPLLQIVAEIERAISEFAPETIYVPHGGNLNIDHQVTFRAALTAARPVPRHPVRRVYAYEVPSSTEWAPPGAGQPFFPTHFVDITAFLEQKMRALHCYAAEIRPAPHARSLDSIRALVTTRGHSAGMTAAEAFVTVRELVRQN